MKQIILFLFLLFTWHNQVSANEIKSNKESADKIKASVVMHGKSRYGIIINNHKNKNDVFLDNDSETSIILKSPFQYNDSTILSPGVSFRVKSTPLTKYILAISDFNIFLESKFNEKTNIKLYYGLNQPIGDKITSNFNIGSGGIYESNHNIFEYNDKIISPYKLVPNTILSEILERKFKGLKSASYNKIYYDTNNSIKIHDDGIFYPLSLGISANVNTENNFTIHYNALYINNMYVDISNDYTLNNNKILVIQNADLDKKIINYYQYAFEGGIGVDFELKEDQRLSVYTGVEYTGQPSSFYFDKNLDEYKKLDDAYNRINGVLFNSEYINGNENEGSYSFLFSYYLSLNRGEPKKIIITNSNNKTSIIDINNKYSMYYYTIGVKKTDFLGSISLSYMYSKQNLIATKNNDKFNRFFAISLDGELDTMAALGIGKKCDNEVCDYILNFKPYAGITYIDGLTTQNKKQKQWIFNMGIKASF